jgi:hypothetical protein
MKSKESGVIHALEFNCQAPLRFYEHCASCARFGDDCPELALGIELLRGRKELVYNKESQSVHGIHVSQFTCMAPLYYFEKSRTKCAHQGRCREEGLLLALLSGNKALSYTQRSALEFQKLKKRRKEPVSEEAAREEAIRP